MGSSYPSNLDAFSTVRTTGQVVQASTDNDHSDAINKIEAELGTNPSGAAATVDARIASVESRSVSALIDLYALGVRSSNSGTTNTNLILNAIAAIPAGISVELVAYADVIPLAPLTLADRTRTITGRDTGIGGVFRGAGLNGTLLKLANGSNADLLTIAGAYWTVKDMGLDGNKENNTAGSCLRVSKPRTTLDNLSIGFAFEHGVINEGLVGDQAHAMLASQLYIKGCHGKGFYNKGLYAPDLQAEGIWIGACDGDGLAVESVAAMLTNVHPWGNGGDGVHITGGYSIISELYSETNTGHGLHYATGANGAKVSNFNIWANTLHGIFLEDLAGVARVGIANGEIHDMGGYGIVGQNSSYVTVQGIHSHDDQGTKTQGYAISTNGTSDRWTITGNLIRGSDHRLTSKLLVGNNNVLRDNVEGIDTWRRGVAATGSIFSVDPPLIAVTDTSAARTLTLPAISAVPAGTEFTIKDETGGAGTNNITVQRAGSDTIDGRTARVINTGYGEVRVYTNGTAWFTKGRRELATPWMPGMAESGSGRDVPVANLTSAGLGLTSGKLFLVGGNRAVLPAGRQVNSISFVTGTTGVTTPTNQWFCLVRLSDLAVLAKTADDTTTAWAAGAEKKLTISGGYTPDVDTAVYFGIVVVAAGMPDLRGWGTVGVIALLPPVIAGNSTGALTNPASLGGTAIALTGNSNLPYAYAS